MKGPLRLPLPGTALREITPVGVLFEERTPQWRRWRKGCGCSAVETGPDAADFSPCSDAHRWELVSQTWPRLTADQVDAIVNFMVGLLKSLRVLQMSLDEVVIAGSREIATVVLGCYRTLNVLHPADNAVWRAALTERFGQDPTPLLEAFGGPSFISAEFTRATQHLGPFDRPPGTPRS